MNIKVGQRCFHTIYNVNVDILRVYKDTVTIGIIGQGMREGKFLQYRGEDKKYLAPKKSINELKQIGAW